MFITRTVSVLSFFGALVIGVAVACFVELQNPPATIEPVIEPVPLSPSPRVNLEPVRPENLLGRWTGTWGRDRAACTLEIRRADGDKFYGTLTKEGTVVLFEGTLDAGAREVSFQETKVVKLAPDMPSWSLGRDSGAFSADGLTLTGSGQDRGGKYGWDAAKE